MKREDLTNLGFTDEEINKMNRKLSSIIFHSTEKLEEEIKYFKSYGYNIKQIMKMFLTFPNILKYDVLNIKNKIELYEDLGIKKENIIKLTVFFPNVFGLSNDNIMKKINYLEQTGYKKIEISKMIKKFPNIIGYTIEYFDKKIEFLKSLGYRMPEIIKITVEAPGLFSYSDSNIENKVNDLIELGYTKEEVIKFTLFFPNLFGHNIDNLKRKIKFLKEINLGFVVVEDTKILIQSVELTYARYMFLKEKGIIIDESNYKKLFFYSKRFERIYNISNEKLLEKYKYEDNQSNKEKVSFKSKNELSDKNREKIEYLKTLQCSDEQIENIISLFPQLYDISLGNIKEKIEFYQSINFLHIILNDPKRLIQSFELTYARYMFFMDNGITIDEKHYHKLFYSNKQIEELYHVTKEELLEKYQYIKEFDDKYERKRKENL